MELPFDGAITDYFENHAPEDIREAVREAGKKDILNPDYPHKSRMGKKQYEKELEALQVELVKLQSWVKKKDIRIACVFEGRDAAGKGGTIKRLKMNLSARQSRVIALTKPTDREAGQWYFQRYVDHLPTEGEIVSFDRSWYNRGVVEHVFGFCTPEEREHFFRQVGPLEKLLTEDDIYLFKFWLNVGRGEQLRRMLKRESDPLKQWKLSSIDVQGLAKWDAYSAAIHETLKRSHSDWAPWTVVKSDDKKRARLNAIRTVLVAFDYDRRDDAAIGKIDREVCAGPEIWDA